MLRRRSPPVVHLIGPRTPTRRAQSQSMRSLSAKQSAVLKENDQRSLAQFTQERGLIMKDDANQRTVDVHCVPVVVDEAKLSEAIHEEAYTRTRSADHLSESFLIHLGNYGHWF